MKSEKNTSFWPMEKSSTNNCRLLKQEKVSTRIPASLLLLHPDVVVILDELAAKNYLKEI